ncbi:hypothetical protein MMC32_004126 [Xylographa parallela]|nr:hypothetical protein [Xylographa parallela]
MADESTEAAHRASKEAELQFRYTELLEKRIAQLEGIIEASSKIFKDDDKDKKDEKPDINGTSEEGDGKSKAVKSDDKEKEKKERYRNVVRKWKKDTGTYEDVDLGEAGAAKVDGGNIAFTFRRVLNQETGSKDGYSEIDIEAEGLRDLLKESIGSNYPGQNFDGETVNMVTPFQPVIHNWDILETSSKQHPDDPGKNQACRDLERLLEAVKTAPELEKYFKTRESNIGASITTYETMWTLFAPKTRVIARPYMKMLQVFEVETAPIPWETPLPRVLEVLVWCWDWNGKEMTKVYFWIQIKKFRGTRDISQLECYPCKFHKGDEEEFMSTLRKRGAKYNRIVRSKDGATQMRHYEGDALSDQRNAIKSSDESTDYERQSRRDEDDNSGSSTENNPRNRIFVKGPFIVDPEASLRYGAGDFVLGDRQPCWRGQLNEPAESSSQDEGTEKEFGDDEFILCPPRLLGYSTKEKMWGQFSVDQTSEMPARETTMFREKLQLNEEYKQMIEALVDEHRGKRVATDVDKVQVKDFVEDKGKGLVLLLHGPPGVGKTLTAETIAEATGKPLFIVSVAEIGLDASKAERNLEQMFYLAGKWEAVLLVDEADVFLEARTSNSEPNRNALVSVLLRVLEYYHGIMILTTNRINSLDIAVQSRIHLAIRYDDLTKTQKKKIFQMFLEQLEPDSIKNHDAITEFINNYGCEAKLNGRQIRNVVSSALSLARSTAKSDGGDPRLTVTHLRQVLSITKDFQEQLESITRSVRAENEATRSRN